MKILLLCCGFLLYPLLTLGADLPAGEWSGTYSFADEDQLRVKYYVEQPSAADAGGELRVTMNVAGVEIRFKEIQLTPERLSFRMNPGEEVNCQLDSAEDGTYKGECVSLTHPDGVQKIKMFMRPPQEGSAEHVAN